MIGVLFYAEDEGSSFFNDIVVWSKTAGVFGVDFLIGIDNTNGGIYKNWEDKSNFKNTHIVNSMEGAFDIIDKEYSDHDIVYFNIDGNKTLGKNFKHPKDNVIYLFGADTGEVNPPRFDHEVKLDIPKEIWGSQVFAVAMYDRGL